VEKDKIRNYEIGGLLHTLLSPYMEISCLTLTLQATIVVLFARLKRDLIQARRPAAWNVITAPKHYSIKVIIVSTARDAPL
jgi:hypothetical protein